MKQWRPIKQAISAVGAAGDEGPVPVMLENYELRYMPTLSQIRTHGHVGER
jgi:hypothetical protein